MKQLRIDSPESVSTQGFDVGWEQDRQFRMHPVSLTALLHEQVPVLDYVRWSMETIEPGYAQSILPLNTPSTNQHFTHQAALFVLAADYTGGAALGSLLHGWPLVGVHPVESDRSASLWLLRAETKYIKPSVGDLSITACVSPELHARVQKRFLAGQAVIETIHVEFRNGSTLVAEADMTYFARRSDALRTEGIAATKVNSLYELKLTSSAELIAGVRALESGGLFEDPFAEKMAGQHGMATAQRFCGRTPQLGGMVAARTWHGDAVVGNFLAGGGRDIILLGVGWDMRAFRLSLPGGCRVFELDFPTTLAERTRRIEQCKLQEQPGVARIQIPIDVRTMPLAPVMAGHLEPGRPVLILWEGMSMYFKADEVKRVLEGMKEVLTHPESLLWVDLVDEKAILAPADVSESVANFMRGMQILGEPFTFGPSSAKDFLNSAGYHCLEQAPSDICLSRRKDPVYSVYSFCVASASAGQPRTFKPSRFVNKPKPRRATRVSLPEGLAPPHTSQTTQDEADPISPTRRLPR